MDKLNFVLFSLALLIIPGLFGCEENTLTLADHFVSKSSDISLIDTVTINLSTVKSDTVKTSGYKTALIGHGLINGFGEVYCQSHIPISYTNKLSYNSREIFDSLTFEMIYSGFSLGDTTNIFKLDFYEITEDFDLNDEDYFYGFNTMKHKEQPFLTKSIKPRPASLKKIEFRLPDSVENRFWNFILELSENNDLNFDDEFKGITIGYDINNPNTIIAFNANDSSMRFNLYSHYSSENRETKIRRFGISDTELQFNQIEAISDYPELNQKEIHKEKIDDYSLDGLSFLIGSAGYNIRIDIPYLNKLLESSDENYIVKAELILKPDLRYCPNSKLPTTINLATVNKINEITGYFTDSDGNLLNGNLEIDYLYNENTFYSFNITSYLNSAMEVSDIDNSNGMMILPQYYYDQNLNYLIIGGENNPKYKSYLRLYNYKYTK